MMWDIFRSYKCSNKVLHSAVYPRGMQARLTNNFEERLLGLMIKVSVETFLRTELILLSERKEVFLS